LLEFPAHFGRARPAAASRLSPAVPMDEIAVYGFALSTTRINAHWDARN